MKPEYGLPFPEFVEKKIAKPIGKYAHENFLQSRYAIDFVLDVGTPILAARSGKVIKTKSDSDRWGLDTRLADESNYVIVDHEDGTYAEYVHLAKDRIDVRKGQKVSKGELLGYSGLSGCMSSGHLHFNLLKMENRKTVSIPIKFSELSHG